MCIVLTPGSKSHSEVSKGKTHPPGSVKTLRYIPIMCLSSFGVFNEEFLSYFICLTLNGDVRGENLLLIHLPKYKVLQKHTVVIQT
jgi:hypothetical protein